jgi:hypothetical protein
LGGGRRLKDLEAASNNHLRAFDRNPMSRREKYKVEALPGIFSRSSRTGRRTELETRSGLSSLSDE